MNITLSKVSYCAALSEETNAFSATVCINGIPAFIASNDGHGGCDRYDPLKGQTYEQMRAKVAEVEAYAKTLPKKKYHSMELEESAESLVGDALNAHLREKDAARLFGKTKDRVVLVDGGKVFTCYKNLVPAQMARAIELVRQKYPAATIINTLTRESGVAELSKALAAQGV